MAPKYTLIYFNVRGLAEVSRLILAQAGVDYEDRRVDKDEEWPKLKPGVPFNHLPVLEVDGVQISESRTIARYLAREHDLAGKNAIEQALADSIVDAVGDSVQPLFKIAMEPDETKKEETRKAYVADTLLPLLKNLEKLRQKHGSNGFLIGDSLTWADIGTAHFVWLLLNVLPNEIASHTSHIEHQQKILSLPRIKEWIDKRPVTAI